MVDFDIGPFLLYSISFEFFHSSVRTLIWFLFFVKFYQVRRRVARTNAQPREKFSDIMRS